MDFFRIALESCGKHDVQLLLGGALQRRKSRTQTLDIPKGMPRNLSESHLVQIGSKALSNVAGQFTKLSQSLHPKVRTGKKIENDDSLNIAEDKVIERNRTSSKRKTTDGKEHYSSDSDENDCSIYEPDTADLVEENPIYAENAFLPSVGIVMASNELTNIDHLENRDNNPKLLENLSQISISSVTDNVVMPAGMLSNSEISVRSASDAPIIQVQEIEELSNLAKSSGLKFYRSADEMRAELSSPVASVASESRYLI